MVQERTFHLVADCREEAGAGYIQLGLWDRWERKTCYSEGRWLRCRVIERVGKDAPGQRAGVACGHRDLDMRSRNR